MPCFNQISTFESIILFIDAKICKKVFIWSILHCQRSTNDIKALKSNYHFMLLKKVYTLKSDFVIKSCFIYLPTFVIRAFLHLTTCNYFLKNALFVFYFNISIKDIKVQNWKKKINNILHEGPSVAFKTAIYQNSKMDIDNSGRLSNKSCRQKTELKGVDFHVNQ